MAAIAIGKLVKKPKTRNGGRKRKNRSCARIRDANRIRLIARLDIEEMVCFNRGVYPRYNRARDRVDNDILDFAKFKAIKNLDAYIFTLRSRQATYIKQLPNLRGWHAKPSRRRFTLTLKLKISTVGIQPSIDKRISKWRVAIGVNKRKQSPGKSFFQCDDLDRRCGDNRLVGCRHLEFNFFAPAESIETLHANKFGLATKLAPSIFQGRQITRLKEERLSGR